MTPVAEQIVWWRENGFTSWAAMKALGLNPDPLDERTWGEVAITMQMKLDQINGKTAA